MLRTWWKLAITLGTVAVLCLVTVPSHAALTVKNTSTYVGAGRWNWTIFVDADPAIWHAEPGLVATREPLHL